MIHHTPGKVVMQEPMVFQFQEEKKYATFRYLEHCLRVNFFQIHVVHFISLFYVRDPIYAGMNDDGVQENKTGNISERKIGKTVDHVKYLKLYTCDNYRP